MNQIKSKINHSRFKILIFCSRLELLNQSATLDWLVLFDIWPFLAVFELIWIFFNFHAISVMAQEINLFRLGSNSIIQKRQNPTNEYQIFQFLVWLHRHSNSMHTFSLQNNWLGPSLWEPTIFWKAIALAQLLVGPPPAAWLIFGCHLLIIVDSPPINPTLPLLLESPLLLWQFLPEAYLVVQWYYYYYYST